ncbi:MAG: ABC-type multidrug transport system fused ATPase/permease subunit [Gammaproteobacteria bacterium]|jgi:ABC-type multidrug transport system fused ATPase/permease subunit
MKTQAGRVRSFIDLYWNYALVGVQPYRARFALITMLDTASALGRAGLIASIALFVGLMESTDGFTVPYLDLTLANNLRSVVLVSALLLVIQLFSAWAAYYSSVEARKLARAFYKTVTVSIMNTYATRKRTSNDRDRFSRPTVQRHLMLGARQSGIAFESLICLIRPLLYCIVAASMMYYLDRNLSLVLLPALVILAPLAYKMSSSIQRDARDFYDGQAQAMGGKINEYLIELDSASYAENRLYPIDESLNSTPEIESFLDGFDRVRLANERMGFMISSLNAAILAIALLIFGYQATTGGRSWSLAVAFLGSLAYLASSAQVLFAYLANLSRFYPQVRGTATFIEDLRATQTRPQSSSKPNTEFELRSSAQLGASKPALKLHAGKPIFVLHPEEINRANFGSFIDPIARGAQAHAYDFYHAQFVSNSGRLLAGTLAQLLSDYCSQAIEREHLLAYFDAFELREELDQLSDGIDTDFDTSTWSNCSKAFRSLCRLIPLLNPAAEIAIVDSRVFARLDEAQRARAITALNAKLLLLVGPQIPGWAVRIADKGLIVHDDNLYCYDDLNDAQAAREALAAKFDQARLSDRPSAMLDETMLG